jgi:hypothetical protein
MGNLLCLVLFLFFLQFVYVVKDLLFGFLEGAKMSGDGFELLLFVAF